MRREVTMPRMGQSMDEGRVLRWLKQVGDEIERGEPIAEIETDKAVVEMESFEGGILVETVTSEGELVPTGAVIAFIEDGQPDTGGDLTELAASPQPKTPESHSDSRVRANASPLAKRLAAEHGIDLRQVRGTGPDGRIGKADIETVLAQRQAGQSKRVNASPVARRLADKLGIDLASVPGTGPGGRIGKADVEAWQESSSAVETKPEVEIGERVQLSKIKQVTARRMAESKAEAPHFYISMDIEMSRALALRDHLKARGHDISINDLLLKATALALAEYPFLNAVFCGDEIQLNAHINLAVAVAIEDGLITPVIHDCESLSLVELAAAARGVIERARSGRLRQEDLDGATFTVSNLGMYGVKHFEAIVNPPQAAILTAGAVRRVPVFGSNDQLVAAELLTATVSADHRVTDGAEVAGFLRELRTVLEGGFDLVSCVT